MNQTFYRQPKTMHHVFWLCLWLALTLPDAALAQETLEAQASRFRLIPGGWDCVWSPPNETGRGADEAAAHKVNLKTFYISLTEITNAPYARSLKAIRLGVYFTACRQVVEM